MRSFKKRLATLALAVLFLSGGISLTTSREAIAKAKEKNTAGPALDNFNTGMKRFKAGDIDGAIDSYLQSIYFARNQYNPGAQFWLGVCYKVKRDFPKAIEAYKLHIEQNMGPSPDGHIELGLCYMETGRDMDAMNEFYTAMGQTMGPAPRAHFALGQLWEHEGKFRDAIEQYRDALGDPPWLYLEAWLAMADCFIKVQDYGSAFSHYQQILAAEYLKISKPDTEKVYNNMGLCMLAKGDHEGAMRKWRECLSMNPSNPIAHLDLAMMFDQEQHISSAITEYKQFLRLAPTDEKAQKVKDRVEALEQKIQPPEPVSSSKPTPYMRQQQEQSEKEKRKAFEELNPTVPATENPF